MVTNSVEFLEKVNPFHLFKKTGLNDEVFYRVDEAFEDYDICGPNLHYDKDAIKLDTEYGYTNVRKHHP